VENPGFASRANLLFSSNAIIDNTGVTVAHLSSSGAPLSIDEVITGTGTWWGIAGQPLDVSGAFTSDLATLSDSLATDASDASYGFIVSSVAIASSPDLPPLTIASSDRAAMPTPITLDFGAISGGGTVTVVPSVQAAEGNISFGANPSVIDIDFTGTFTGSVEVCIGYDPAQYYAGSSILLFHYIGGAWVDVTSSVDESTRRVCGLVSSFSPFAAGEELAVYSVTYDANEGALAGGEDTSYTFGDAAIRPGPGKRFEIDDLIGLQRRLAIDVDVAGQFVLAAAEVEFQFGAAADFAPTSFATARRASVAGRPSSCTRSCTTCA
jgi:hypothetical protein